MNRTKVWVIENFKKTILFWFFVVGVILIIVSYTLIKSEIISQLFRSIATAAFIGAGSTAVLKAMQMSGVFQKSLSDIIYTPEYLDTRKDIDSIWRATSKALYIKEFPKIGEELIDVLYKSYFPINHDIYYENYNLLIDIKWFDKRKRFIDVTDKLHVEIIAKPGKKNIPYTYENVIEKEKGCRITYCDITMFSVNGVNQLPVFQESISKDKKYMKDLCYKTTGLYKLDGKEKYEIVLEAKKRYSLKYDNTRSFISKHIVKNLKLQVHYPDDIHIYFMPIGTTEDFTDDTPVKGIISKQYNNLIFPKQGFIFTYLKQ